jgi:hypothetical protein
MWLYDFQPVRHNETMLICLIHEGNFMRRSCSLFCDIAAIIDKRMSTFIGYYIIYIVFSIDLSSVFPTHMTPTDVYLLSPCTATIKRANTHKHFSPPELAFMHITDLARDERQTSKAALLDKSAMDSHGISDAVLDAVMGEPTACH